MKIVAGAALGTVNQHVTTMDSREMARALCHIVDPVEAHG
jgi:hypothetical protein